LSQFKIVPWVAAIAAGLPMPGVQALKMEFFIHARLQRFPPTCQSIKLTGAL
jgi:hypothetical protein